MRTIEQIFGTKKIIPAVAIENPDLAVKTALALLEGGINVMMVRMLSPKSLKSLEKIVKEVPQITVGAAGVMDAASFFNASLSGASFMSSFGSTNELLTASRTRYNDAHYIPGVMTATHIMEVLTRGFDVVHLFPIAAINGDVMLDNYQHAFPKLKFALSGGVDLENLAKYIVKENVIAVSLSHVATSKLINEGDFAEITRLAKESVDIANKALEPFGVKV